MHWSGGETVFYRGAPSPLWLFTAIVAVFRTNLLFDQQTDVKAIKIVFISLIEPDKLDVLRLLGIPTSAEEIGRVQPDTSIIIPRRADSAVIDAVAGTGYYVKLSVADAAVNVDTVEMLAKGVEPGITMEELIAAEETVRNDPRVQKLCADVGVLPHQICAGEHGSTCRSKLAHLSLLF